MRAASALVLAFALTASAQTLTPESLGTVTGHVLCADTQQPARFADVRLVPVPKPADLNSNVYGGGNLAVYGGALPSVQTDITGNYTIRNVRPGEYYLSINYIGYLTSILTFTPDQLAKPSLDIQKRIASELTIVNVASHATTHADATILRGGSISGTILYDDGSPAIGLHVNVFHRNEKGEFKDVLVANKDSYTYSFTDMHGHFSIPSLPAGSYIVMASFSMIENVAVTVDTPGYGDGTMQDITQRLVFSLPLYSGNVFRRKDAEVIRVEAGHDTPSVDLTIPLSKLHNVSGTLIAKDGHTIHSGRVALLYADTRERLTDVPVNRDDGQFHFPYVPEDSYILDVQEASDITQVEVPGPAGTNTKPRRADKTLHTYGTVEQPLIVTGEVPSVLITVPEKSAASSPATPAP